MRESETTAPTAMPDAAPATDRTAEPQTRRPGRLRRLLSRLSADPDTLDDEELKAATTAQGATPIAQCTEREAVCILGTLRTVTFRPRAGVPALQAELWDGTGSVTVVWLGRSSIAGITPGRNIKIRGRITALRGQRVIYNPIYELRPGPTD